MNYLGRAYIAALAVGGLAPLVGTYVVQRRLALIGDGLGHLAFAGAALASVLAVASMPVSLAVATAGAAFIELLQRRAGTRADVALAVIFYFGIAAGVVMLSASRTFNSSALTILFGSLLTISTGDLLLIVSVMAAATVFILAFRRTLFLLVLGEETAEVAGMRVGLIATLLSVVTAAVVVAGMRAVGVLLVAALLVLPAAAGQRLATSFRSGLLLSVAIGALTSLGGVWLAVHFDSPPGATIVLLAVAIYLAAIPVSGLRNRNHREPLQSATEVSGESPAEASGAEEAQ